MDFADSTRWIAAPPDEFVWTEAGQDFIAYHRPSGTTHLLNSASYVLLTELLRAPKNLSELHADFADVDVRFREAAFANQLAELVSHLERLGMLSRARD